MFPFDDVIMWDFHHSYVTLSSLVFIINTMIYCKTAVCPLLKYWRYYYLALSHRAVISVTLSYMFFLQGQSALLTMAAIKFCRTRSLTFRPRQIGLYVAGDIFKSTSFYKHFGIFISLKFVPNGSNCNKSTLIQMMAWRRTGFRSLSGPVIISFMFY